MDRKNVAAIYELTPMQQGMFFHSRYGGEGEVYFTQFRCHLRADLDADAFRDAWHQVIERHPVLRSSFVWQKLDKPLQIVHREVDLPLESLDWSERPDHDDAVEAFLAEDRRRGFELGSPPLMRLALLRLGERDHLLVWSHHHLLLDGWSVGLVLREVFALYRAGTRGERCELPTPRPYKDFVLWLQEQSPDDAEAYWRDLLKGFAAPTPLGLERCGQATPRWDYDRVFRTLPAETTSRLGSLARRHRVTLNTLFQGAWTLLLRGLSRQHDVVFGSTTSGRPPEIRGVEGMVGMFINTLPVRVTTAADRPLGDALREIQETQARGREYEHTPLARIQQWSDVPAGTPLFESLVIFENLPAEQAGRDGDIEVVSAGFSQRTNYPLTLAVSPRGDELFARLAYPTERFDRSTVRRLLRGLENLLAAMAEEPDARLETFSTLGPSERHQVLVEWNDSRRRRRPHETVAIHRLIADQADRAPDATAALVAGREVSYRELVDRARRLAGRLYAMGVGAEEPVAICVERSLDMLVAVLGTLESGAAYLPLDPAYPEDRLRFTLADAGARVLLTQERFEARFADYGDLRIVTLNEERAPWGAGSGAESAGGACPTKTPGRPALVDPGQLAYVIYTSGSTGRPKGVMVEHRTLTDRVHSMIDLFGLGPGHRQLQFVSLGFDVSCEEIFAPLSSGAALVLVPDIQARVPSEMLAECGRQGVTKVNVPASYWHQLVDELENLDRRVPECVEMLVTGAEAPSPEKLLRWRARAPSGSRFFNIYGPTEATVMCSAERRVLDPDEDPRDGHLPIGRPLPNTSLYLLDAGMRPAPTGAPGELLIGGADVTRGYLARPGLTAERFVPDAFGVHPGARLYRTGDLARHLPDGKLEFAGRIDHQVKIRGFRVELGEIEEALRRHPEVDGAVVLLREDSGGKQLVAYVVTAADVSVRELREYLGENLPEHMVPALFVFLDEIPLTANNKIDRAALPAPGGDRPELETDYLAPRTELESFLAEIWRDILGVEQVGVKDNFFELGGDSLKGAVFINRVEAKLGEYVYVVALFESPTVEGYAAYLARHCPAAVRQHFGDASVDLSADSAPDAERTVTGRLDASHVEHVRGLVEPLAPPGKPASKPNPTAVFVLSPPRSGSTLFRVLLAGHPALFAPPELDLLSFNTLAERRATFSGGFAFWLEGTLRALMEIEGCDSDEARRLMEDCEARGLSSKQFYGFLQERLGERLLVDKTPSYALDPEILRRAEEDFENPRFIHLLRHPCGMINSFEKARIDELFFRYEHPYTPRQLGELTWNLCHRNILDFLDTVAAERRHVVTYEELVAEPEKVLGGVCDFLGLELVPAMLDPYGDTRGRMTDGIHPLAKMLGDVKFHEHRGIDPRTAWRWREVFDHDFLGAMTWELAESLGYEKPEEWREKPAPIELLPREAEGEFAGGGRFALSFAQKRLWVLDRISPGTSGYNMPAAVRVRGELDENALARAVATLVARHETLRTRFVEIDGEPWQVVEPPAEPDFFRVDFEGRQKEAERFTAEEMARPFDLERGPLLRVRLVRHGADDHTLLVNLHHIVSDGWSQGVLVRELVSAYQGSSLPELPLQYADFAAWQNARLTGRRLEEMLDVWRRRLAGAPVELELPTDRPRPAVRGFAGARRRASFGRDLAEAVKAHGQRRGATAFMTLLAAFAAALVRHSGQTDVLIGSPVAGRGRLDLENLIGFFVNTLVLRADVSGDPSFAELVDRLREVTLEALAHQELPFEKLVEELRPERSTSRQPLFQVAFALQNLPRRTFELAGLTFETVESDSASAKFDLTLSLTETAQGLEGSLEYATDVFDETTAERFLDHLGHLLASVAADPECRVGRLGLLSDVERRLLVEAWPGDGRLVAAGEPLTRLFEARVDERPTAPALTFEGRSLTYGELDRRANRLARVLAGLGVGAEKRVGLFVDRGPNLVVGVLGILKAGGAYVPADPVYPAERVAYMLGDAEVDVVVTERALEDRLPAGLGRIRLDADSAALDAESDERPGVSVAPDHLAYVIYTSGSTGRPKGTLVTHRHVARLLAATDAWFGFGAGDVWTLFHSIAFDFTVWELWGALAYGGRLVIPTHEVSRSPRAFAGLLESEGVTVLNQTPSAFRQLLAVEAERGPLAAPLRWVIFGGEALDVAALAPWWRRHGEDAPRLVNMYGITETTVHVSYRPLGTADLATGWRSVVGSGIPDLELYVLDTAGAPSPIGVAGEIHVGGGGVARGYLGRPALTAERFVPHGLARRAGRRLYRSGDLGRWRLAPASFVGDLEYLGRLDHQVKVRGFRIELGEIEAVLEGHAAVSRAVVLPRDYGDDDRRLVAYLAVDATVAAPLLRRLAPRDPDAPEVHELSDGLAVYHLNRSETEFLEREIFSERSYLRHGVTIEPGDAVFDVGANIGLFSLQAARHGARVYAFEPIPPVHDVLRRNFELHGIAGRAFDCGLADRPGTARFTFYPEISVISGRYADASEEREVVKTFLLGQEEGVSEAGVDELLDERLRAREVDCPLRTVSEILRQEGVERLDLLKVDVEKSELEVLLGVDEGDWPKIRQVVVEVHDVDGRLGQVRSLLAGHGFELFQEEDPSLRSTGLHSLWAIRPEARREASAEPPGPAWSSPRRLEEALRSEARRRLPEYMVPAACVFVGELPLTANGKLDRAALEALPLPGRDDGSGTSEAARAEPADELERGLAALFEELLGRGPVSVTDDFFALGGHSLLAVRLMAEIRGRHAVDLPLATLFQGGTVRRLAAAVRRAGRGQLTLPLVEIQAGHGDVLPLFCVHPGGGNVLCYAELARALGPEQPVYGLQAHGLVEGETPDDTVEAMAERYVAAVRGLRPQGPYALAGWSLGGLVAYEMAHRLRAGGAEVARLAILDVRAGRASRDADEPRRTDAEMLIAALEGVTPLDAGDLGDLGSDASVEAVMQKLSAAGALPEGFTVGQARRHLDVFGAGRRAAASYEPPSYDGPVDVFRAMDRPPGTEAPSEETLGWRRHVRGVLRIHQVPGGHRTLVRQPHVRRLAGELLRLLRTTSATPG